MGKIREWQPDSDTKIIGEQIDISRISLELCCSHILAGLQRHGQFRDVRLALDELLNQTVGAVRPTLYTLMGRDNKAFQNTADRRAMAKEIGTAIKMYFDNNASLKDFTKIALFNEVDDWSKSVTPQPPASQEPATARELPSKLDTKPARKYFARAVDAGLMNKQFEWLASQALLACFCRDMSVNLDLGKGYNSEGQKRLSWKPFEQLFNVKAKNLITSLNDIKKTGQNPIGIEKVEAIFRD